MSAREVTFVDNGDSVIASVAGAVQGATWGPAADSSGEWFVLAAGEPSACREADKLAGIAELSKRLGGAS